MKIGHISDLHWLDMTGAAARDFFNKRLSGAFNLLAGRARKHTHEAVISALETLKSNDIDHLVITGDLTNLALPGEFSAVRSTLDRYFDENHRTIVPGNHDFYTGESARAKRFVEMIYGGKCPGDICGGTDHAIWPYAHIRDDVAVIALNSAQPRPWFVAAGRLGQQQLDDFEKLLERREIASRYKIVALHHHLFRALTTPGEMLRHLDDRKRFLDICTSRGVGLILHGHNHDYTQLRVGETLISDAGSCSVSHFKRDRRAGKFNIYHIENGHFKSAETWRCVDGTYQFWRTADADQFQTADPKDL